MIVRGVDCPDFGLFRAYSKIMLSLWLVPLNIRAFEFSFSVIVFQSRVLSKGQELLAVLEGDSHLVKQIRSQ